ncbi:hypothetical protein DC498_17715 [Terrimonas sp.]|uniref:hypothetical protein n=1 Tax=Terrimonas sp. TaxID=1914338 RepID=UPI000D5221DA|nr:hypothetical protein [Terrimonas sp.]PVD50810.1 hypothetical protein DC498_17715 [Terrimonas sp.]
MQAQNKLFEKERTVTFTEEEAEVISRILFSFCPADAAEALEEIAQNLLNDTEKLHSDIGQHYFLLRQLKEFHAALFERLKPIRRAYHEAEVMEN